MTLISNKISFKTKSSKNNYEWNFSQKSDFLTTKIIFDDEAQVRGIKLSKVNKSYLESYYLQFKLLLLLCKPMAQKLWWVKVRPKMEKFWKKFGVKIIFAVSS